MGKMTEDAIRVLFDYGKKVYQGEIPLKEAAERVHEDCPEVAVSSARHYVRWYGEMKKGKILTWNSNSELLLYYAERIIRENEAETGKTACRSVLEFAAHANRTELADEVYKLADKYHLNLDENMKNGNKVLKDNCNFLSSSAVLQHIQS